MLSGGGGACPMQRYLYVWKIHSASPLASYTQWGLSVLSDLEQAALGATWPWADVREGGALLTTVEREGKGLQ